MTKSELDTLDSVFLAPLILFVNQYLGTKFSESRLLWISLVRMNSKHLCLCLKFIFFATVIRDF